MQGFVLRRRYFTKVTPSQRPAERFAQSGCQERSCDVYNFISSECSDARDEHAKPGGPLTVTRLLLPRIRRVDCDVLWGGLATPKAVTK